ncbi:phage major capsid protein [Bacillus thuringiensis]|uniref:phage major capsid protein n=1 Tax=Bacillus thuringiensis TaxID=1428 RepID=UPI000BF91D66|nr:phage major capsid protein [Bacillus thuringiensis]MED3681825.1 phage major capsid protein [Bacillus thuringiensis]PFT17934.1 phage major capsid protein [Bacillus thuringiensis]
MQNHNNQIELRNVRLDGVQQNADGSLLVSGYVNETGTWSQVLGRNTKFIEQIRSGAFKRALERAENIDFLYEHDNKKILADTQSGKLVLREDERGLYMEATISKTTWGQDAFELIKDGIIQKMSFGFRALKDKVTKGTNGIYERVVHELELLEVSAVRKPAYVQSSIAARSLEIVDEINIREDINTMNITELKNTRLEIIKHGKQLKVEQRKRDLDEFEKAEMRDLSERLEKIEAQIEIFTKDEQRHIVEIPEETSNEPSAEQRAIESVLKGEMNDEVRALATNTSTGAYLVPTTVSDHIVKIVHHEGNLFSRTRQYEPVNGFLEILREDGIIGNTGFIGEWDDLDINDFNLKSKVRLDQKRVGSAVELSNKVVNDAGMNVLAYASELLGRRLSKTIDEHILFGDGKNSLEGILTLDSLGKDKIKTITSASQTTIDFDEIFDVLFSVNPEYTNNAVWVMHSSTFAHLLKIKNEKSGIPLILSDKITNAPKRELLDIPIVFDDNMEQISAGKTPILLGNFEKGYATLVKKDFHLQHIWKDRISKSKRRHLLILDKYLDGKIMQPEAFAKLKMAK